MASPAGASLASELTLAQIDTDAAAADLIRGFELTERFRRVSFDNFQPDPHHPSQQAALESARRFVAEVQAGAGPRWWGRRRSPAGPAGLYLDGGFGVGKTHLLAAAYRAAPEPKAYLSFAELAYAIGALGMEACLTAFRSYRLLCIDEFELDDVANTRLAATVLDRLLNDRHPTVRFMATSNTLPDALGLGRFNAEDFRREIGRIAAAFEVVHIEGDDYRRRPLGAVGSGVLPAGAPAVLSPDALRRAYHAYRPGPGSKLWVRFPDLLTHLASLHPIRYARLVAPLEALFIEGLAPIEDQAMALRFVHVIDKVYDQDVRLAVSGPAHLEGLFLSEYREKGYKKKYQRSLSRMAELLAENGPMP